MKEVCFAIFKYFSYLKLLPLPEGISVDPSEDYLSNEDGQRVSPSIDMTIFK